MKRDPEEKATYRARWYKANIEKIKEELEKMGYQLDYYKDQKNGIRQNDKSQNQGISAPKTPKPASLRIRQNDEPSRQNDGSPRQNDEHLLYTSFITQSFNLDVVELFRTHMGIEITGEEAQLVATEAEKHQKDIEKAIQETVAWAKTNGKELTSPVGSVLYAIQTGWNLSTYQPKTPAKQGSQRKGKKVAVEKKLPEMLKIQMEQEQPQQMTVESVDPEERQKQIREKLRLMNEKFAVKK